MSFQQAIATANSNRGKKDLSNDQLLQLYAHFKQGSTGANNTPKPGMLDLKGQAKWNSWKALGGMSPATAQAKYVALVAQYFK
jgi:acyl-CoA-binding protein